MHGENLKLTQCVIYYSQLLQYTQLQSLSLKASLKNTSKSCEIRPCMGVNIQLLSAKFI